MDHEAYVVDSIDLVLERVARGQLGRRAFLTALGLLGLGPAGLAPRLAEAQGKPKEIVVANWGGDAVKHFFDAWGKPYEKDTGIKVVIDGTGPSAGKLRAMVEAKNVTWDVADAGSGTCLILGKQGILDEFDYKIVDRSKVRPEFAYKWGIANYLFSYVLAYDKSKFGSNPPKSWQDFWDTKNFPGKRTLRKDIQGVLEIALMADGMPADPKKLYPLDEKRGLDAIRRIKKETVFWTSGAQSQELLRDGECSMGCLWNTRATALYRDTKGRIDFTWNQGILCPGVWVVPKGNPAGKAVYDFVKSTQNPERQVALLVAFGNGPANPAAAPLVPADLRRFDPGYPDNAKLQVAMDAEWYGEHQDSALAAYIDAIS
ncbi:MAG TPA: ABC transporter substrate-binding protein [Candidatus Methylomirabilis sp.]|nr:ABC transporter substrate-binding protein [Candidatus Methylomirabilis sp.]